MHFSLELLHSSFLLLAQVQVEVPHLGGAGTVSMGVEYGLYSPKKATEKDMFLCREVSRCSDVAFCVFFTLRSSPNVP